MALVALVLALRPELPALQLPLAPGLALQMSSAP